MNLQITVTLLFLICYAYEAQAETESPPHEVIFLQSEVCFNCCDEYPYSATKHLPMIYCYEKSPPAFERALRTTHVVLNITPERYTLFEGGSAEEVWAQYQTSKGMWYPAIFNWRKHVIALDSFNDSCLGILTSEDYSIRLEILYVDGTRLFFLMLGLNSVFFSAKLSRQSIFFYVIGVSFGVIGSLLIVVYFLLRLIPMRKTMTLGFLSGGATCFYYGYVLLEKQIKAFMYTHVEYVVAYVVSSALISFMVCYRFGPVVNHRSIQLIKWALQAFGLMLIYLSISINEFSIVLIICIIVGFLMPPNLSNLLFTKLKSLWERWRLMQQMAQPPPLLTEEEYIIQGQRVTNRELQNLREFCNSSNFHEWQRVVSLRDPHRFITFINGESHVSVEERQQYDIDNMNETDDEEVVDGENWIDEDE